ncbi:MAG: hypothetical protein K0R57_3096 [Paenibacillaceae bacterium]|jgi:alpha-mannosidase|nr:hypothetical protein [Paenibacillaceae bacterium]
MAFAKRIQRFIEQLHANRWKESVELHDWSCRRAVYVEEGEYIHKEGTETVSPHGLDSTPGETLFLEKRVVVPAGWQQEKTGLVFLAGGEGLLSVNGMPYHGLDKNRSFVPLSGQLAADGEFSVMVELYHVPPLQEDHLNRQVDAVSPPVHFQDARLVAVNTAVESLYYTVTVCWEGVKRLPEGDMERIRMIQILQEAMLELPGGEEELLLDHGRVSQTEEKIRRRLAESTGGISGAVMHMVGQSHIDLAWLWPLKETVRKSSRTFSTVCTLMEQYPEYRYSQSQPQLYAYVKEHYPELYMKIKERIAEGRWELVGGMWVEPDLNIPSGESLVRQLLYGRRFYQEEFGRNSRVEWLPDTFGYCASLPQLLKKSGVDYFMTSKMNWNDTNPFPYDLFYWTGIDGTSILSFLNHGLNENTLSADIGEHWDSFRQKTAHPEQMLLYGFGDGGGGVTREMLEYVERSENLPGLPSCRFSTAHEFFDGVAQASPKLPRWTGDMYLELHRGTYTTHGRNKRFNRKAEVLYREAEVWNALSVLAGAAELKEAAELQRETLAKGWKLLLLNQFHDIIPGTSISEVYSKSEQHYNEVFACGDEALQTGLSRLVRHISTEGHGQPVVLFNSLSWERGDLAEIRGGRELEEMTVYDEAGAELESDLVSSDNGQSYVLHVKTGGVPAMGYKTVWLRPKSQDGAAPDHGSTQAERLTGSWETVRWRLLFDEAGRITSWVDKENGRELVEPGQAANHLQLFHDRPTVWDAWDIDPQFDSQPAEEAELVASEVAYSGKTLDILRMKWRLGKSVVEQDILLHHHSARVDFRTRVDWQETHKLLKAAFPVRILASKATYEIPFGSIERPTHTNTSWEQAQFEVCGHRWADLSEGGYGISLLNDCKYGYDIKGNVMRLSLLRSPRWPDASCDRGVHEFVYSIYPHQGDWRTAGVVREGYELNHPVVAVPVSAHNSGLPSTGSFLSLSVNCTVLDSLKVAEDGQGVILRLYESSGGREAGVIHLGEGAFLPAGQGKLAETDLMEEATGHSISVQDGAAAFRINPYEVLTFRLNADRS